MERSADWMRQAKHDLDHARTDLLGEYYEWACFSAQQAGEKAVKSVFQALGAEARGHSVSDLLRLLPDDLAAPEDLVLDARGLDRFHLDSRHPSATAEDACTHREAERAIAHADAVLRFCDGHLSRLHPQ